MTEPFSTEGERYRIAIGKFGAYFVDEDTGSEMTLEEVTTALNDSAACVNALADIEDPEAFMRDVRAYHTAEIVGKAFLGTADRIRKHLKGGDNHE